MGLLRNRLFRRFSILGRLADIALVAAMAVRLAQRNGWLDDATMQRFGLGVIDTNQKPSLSELGLAGGAAWRLARRVLRR